MEEEEEEEEEEAAMHQSVVVVRHCSGRGVEADIPGEQQALGWSVEEEEEEEEEASVEAALLGMGEVAEAS